MSHNHDAHPILHQSTESPTIGSCNDLDQRQDLKTTVWNRPDYIRQQIDDLLLENNKIKALVFNLEQHLERCKVDLSNNESQIARLKSDLESKALIKDEMMNPGPFHQWHQEFYEGIRKLPVPSSPCSDGSLAPPYKIFDLADEEQFSSLQYEQQQSNDLMDVESTAAALMSNKVKDSSRKRQRISDRSIDVTALDKEDRCQDWYSSFFPFTNGSSGLVPAYDTQAAIAFSQYQPSDSVGVNRSQSALTTGVPEFSLVPSRSETKPSDAEEGVKEQGRPLTWPLERVRNSVKVLIKRFEKLETHDYSAFHAHKTSQSSQRRNV